MMDHVSSCFVRVCFIVQMASNGVEWYHQIGNSKGNSYGNIHCTSGSKQARSTFTYRVRR